MRSALAALSIFALAAASPVPERITLQDALTRATTRNTSLLVAADEVRRAEALVEQARSASLPTLGANAAYTRLDAERTLQGHVIVGRDQIFLAGQLSVPLVAPKSWLAWSYAEDNAAVTRASSADERRTIGQAVGRAYVTIVSQRRLVEVVQRAMQNDRAHLDYASARLEGGLGNRIDVVRAEQQLSSDDAQAETAGASLARAREALGVLVGVDGPLDAADEAPLAEAPALDAALKEAAEVRSDVKAAHDRAALAAKQSSNDWADYLPTLLGTAQPFYQNPASLVNPQTGWQAQLVLSWPLYDGGLRYGQQHERAALTKEAAEQVDGLLRQARSEVRAAFEVMQRADAALVAARKAAASAEEVRALSTLAYQAGATTNLEVIDAERRALDAATTAALSEDSSRQARLDLLVASGRFPP